MAGRCAAHHLLLVSKIQVAMASPSSTSRLNKDPLAVKPHITFTPQLANESIPYFEACEATVKLSNPRCCVSCLASKRASNKSIRCRQPRLSIYPDLQPSRRERFVKQSHHRPSYIVHRVPPVTVSCESGELYGHLFGTSTYVCKGSVHEEVQPPTCEDVRFGFLGAV
jgi:hypothetical protein